MLSKNVFEELKDFLEKHEDIWLSEKQPEGSGITNMVPLTDWIVKPGVVPAHASIRPSYYLSGDASLDEFLNNKQIFADIFMDEFGDVSETYKKACLSKSVFLDIFDRQMPSKDAIIMFAFTLEATLQEAEELLKYAGYSLGICVKRDLIFRFCFEKRIMGVSDVNELMGLEGERELGRKKI
jgi:hypothetical protein